MLLENRLRIHLALVPEDATLSLKTLQPGGASGIGRSLVLGPIRPIPMRLGIERWLQRPDVLEALQVHNERLDREVRHVWLVRSLIGQETR